MPMTTGPDHNPLIDEQLSAWLDDELRGAELELLVARLERSPELKARLARYSLIGSSLRGGQSGNESTELAALRLGGRVRAALEEPGGPERQHASGHTRRLLPYALAAGVALVAVAVTVVQGPLLRPVADPVPGSTVGEGAQASAERPDTVGQAALSPQRLTHYLVYHGEYSGLLSARVTESHIVNDSSYAVALQSAYRSPTQ